MKGGECMPKPDQRYPSKLLRSIFRAAFLTSVFMEFTQISALLIDGIITAKYLGTDAIAAVGLSSPFFFFVGIIGTSFAIGLQTVCTKEIGRGDTDRANAIIYETMIFVLILSVAFSIAIAINIPRGVYLLGARGDALNLKTPAEQYLYGLVLEIVPYILVSIFIPVVILDNGSKTVMIASFLGTVTDIVFDILAVSMKKGIYGIGFATSVSTIVSLAVLFTHFLKKERMLAFHPVPIRFRDIKEIVILSLPKAVHQLAGVIRPIFLNLLVVSVGGSLAMSVMSIRTQLSDFVDIPAVGISGALALLAGIGYGEKNREDIKDTSKIAYYYILMFSAVITVFLIVFSRPLAVFYLKKTSPVLPLMQFAIITLAVGSFLSEMIYSIIAYLQATEHIKKAQFLEMSVNLISLLVFAFLLSTFFGIYGIFAAFPVSQLIVLLGVYLFTAKNTGSFKPSLSHFFLLDNQDYPEPENVIIFPIQTEANAILASEQTYSFCEKHQVSHRVAMLSSLVIEEVTAIIQQHSHPIKRKKNEAFAEIRVVVSGPTTIIRIRDNGVELNISKLAKIQEPSADDPAASAGIKIVCQTANRINYYYIWKVNTTIIEL